MRASNPGESAEDLACGFKLDKKKHTVIFIVCGGLNSAQLTRAQGDENMDLTVKIILPWVRLFGKILLVIAAILIGPARIRFAANAQGTECNYVCGAQ